MSTTTIEHDFRSRFSGRPPPRHLPDPKLLGDWYQVARHHTFPFGLRFGAIASGDEDVIDAARAQELYEATGALCVAWEGSGGAHRARTHLSLDKDAPHSRPIERPELGKVIPIRQVGGLHHRYVRLSSRR